MTQDFDALAQVASFLSGGTPSKANPQYWNGLIPWLTPKDMSQYDGVTTDSVSASAIGNGTRLAPSDALFIAVRGMSLHSEIRIVRAQREMAFNQDIKAIVPRGIDRDFLFFALQSRIPELLAAVEAAGHGTGRLPTDRLESLTIPRFGPAQEKKRLSAVSSG
ncbi:MAG: restriction endonuclease subunit S [Hyphomicrobiaceae bacterium]